MYILITAQNIYVYVYLGSWDYSEMKNYCCKTRHKEFLSRDVATDRKHARVKVKCRGKFAHFYFALEKIQLISFFFN